MYAIEEFCRTLGDVPHSTDAITLRTKSRDYYGISPLLRGALAGRIADVVVTPRSHGDAIATVRAAVQHRIPITVRGGGTANYGQSVPTQGGIVLDMTSLSGVVRIEKGNVRALAGTSMADIDAVTRPQGWELRLHPSTRSTATVAGFIAGGSGGMGSCTWGMLRDRGNITALGVISAEAEPRLLELRGRDVDLVHHAYGTNAIILEAEMPLAPAWEWRECIVALPDFMGAARFGIQLARETGIVKKLISLQEWPVAELMRDLKSIVPNGHSMANCMVAAHCFEAFECLVTDFGGDIVSNHAEGNGPYRVPLYEFAYGHGLKQVQRTNPKFTGLQGMFPASNLLGSIEAVHKRFAGTMPLRMEIFYSQGEVVAMGSHYIVYESEQQMAALVEAMQSEGVNVANNHANSVREVGIKLIGERDAAFKQSMDPFNLLNPGKFDFGSGAESKSVHVLPTRGWTFQRAKSA